MLLLLLLLLQLLHLLAMLLLLLRLKDGFVLKHLENLLDSAQPGLKCLDVLLGRTPFGRNLGKDAVGPGALATGTRLGTVASYLTFVFSLL